MKPFILTLVSTFLFLTSHNLVMAQGDVIFFYSDRCEDCDEVIEVVEERNLEEELDLYIIKEDDDDFKDIFDSALAECGLDSDTESKPVLYYGGECSVGTTDVIATLNELADIEKNETEDEEEEITVNETLESRPFYHYIIMIIGPAILIILGYSMIKKLNL